MIGNQGDFHIIFLPLQILVVHRVKLFQKFSQNYPTTMKGMCHAEKLCPVESVYLQFLSYVLHLQEQGTDGCSDAIEEDYTE